MPPEEVHAQEAASEELEIRKKHPITLRPIYVTIKDVSSVHKWYTHDQFKPENQVKKVSIRASEEAVTSKLYQLQSSIQMLMPSNGQRIARKHMKEQAFPTKPGHPAPTTWNEKVP